MLPSELEERMTQDDFYKLCIFMAQEPLPTNKLDYMQAAITTTTQGLFHQVKYEDNLNPWVKPKHNVKKVMTKEERLKGQVEMIMGLSKQFVKDENGEVIPYDKRFELFKEMILKAEEKKCQKKD